MKRRTGNDATSPLWGEVAERSKIARRVRGPASQSLDPLHPDLAEFTFGRAFGATRWLDPTSPHGER
jgi:hypothetical protein